MTDDMFSLTGKHALITGGSRGLGLAIAHALAGHGADVVIASRKLDACTDAADDIAAIHGVRTWAMACNVSDWDQCTALAREAEEVTGGIDILVNNAGLSPLYPSLPEVSEALYDKVFDVNLKGPFRLGVLVADAMAARGGGSIINVASTETSFPSPAALPYAMAKNGIHTLTEGLARAYGPRAVRVNTITPGPFLTDVSRSWDMTAFDAMASSTMALGRGGQPNEIAAAAVYLASRGASFTTGATIDVDGGTFSSFY